MKKKIMILVFAMSLFQSVGAESFDDLMFEEQRGHVLTDIQITQEPEKKNLTMWAAFKLAPHYVYETHLKPRYYAMVAVLFKSKKKLHVKG